MFRSFDPYAEEEPPFGFRAPSPHAPAGQALIGVKTHLGWAKPRWTATGSMWLEGEDFSLPLSRFAPGTLEPVFETQPERGAAPSIQPAWSPTPTPDAGRGAPTRPLQDQRLFDAVDTHLGRATPHWGEDASLSLEIDGVRRPLHHFAAHEIKAVHEPGNRTHLYGSLGADTLAGGRGEDDLLGRRTSGLAGPLPLHQPQSRPDQSQSRKFASTGPMPWDPSREGLAENAGRWVRGLLGGSRRANPEEVAAPKPAERTAPPPLVEGTEVDWTIVAGHETPYGRSDLEGHIPAPGSGVTVGHGVDLGQWSARELQNFGLSDSTLRKALIFAGLKDSAARAAWDRNQGANFTNTEADELTMAVRRHMLQTVKDRFNAVSTIGRFEDLPPNTQTVLMDVYFHHGHNAMSRTPKSWRAMTTGNWQGAHDELMDFGDKAGPRRKADARMLQEDIKAGRLPAATTRRQ